MAFGVSLLAYPPKRGHCHLSVLARHPSLLLKANTAHYNSLAYSTSCDYPALLGIRAGPKSGIAGRGRSSWSSSWVANRRTVAPGKTVVPGFCASSIPSLLPFPGYVMKVLASSLSSRPISEPAARPGAPLKKRRPEGIPRREASERQKGMSEIQRYERYCCCARQRVKLCTRGNPSDQPKAAPTSKPRRNLPANPTLLSNHARMVCGDWHRWLVISGIPSEDRSLRRKLGGHLQHFSY